jgi:serine protease Do
MHAQALHCMRLFVFGAASFIASAPPAHAQIDRAKFIQMSGSIAKVEALSPAGRLGVGTGVTVADGWVATNCHVTRQAQELRVVKGGVRFEVTAQLVDAKHDLCILKAKNWPSMAVPLGSSQRLKPGQVVAGLGFVGGIELSLRDGMVVALHPYDQAKVIQTDASFTSGASGGGLFDEQGQLIGLMTFRLRGGDNHYFVIPVEWVNTLLDKRSAVQMEVNTEFEGAFWQQSAPQQPYFLQAISFVQSVNWQGAKQLSQAWVKEEPDNAESWYYLGLSLSKTPKEPTDNAQVSMEQVLVKLESLDVILAAELRQAIKANTNQ